MAEDDFYGCQRVRSSSMIIVSFLMYEGLGDGTPQPVWSNGLSRFFSMLLRRLLALLSCTYHTVMTRRVYRLLKIDASRRFSLVSSTSHIDTEPSSASSVISEHQ